MNTLGRTLIALSTLLGCADWALAQQAIDIKPRWIPGKRYVQSIEMQNETKIDLGGQSLSQKMSYVTDASITVTPHEDPNKKRISQRFTRMLIDIDMAGTKIHIDSSKPDGNDPTGAAKALSTLTSKEIKLVMDDKGKIVDFENADELAAGLAGALGAGNPVGEMVKGAINKESISQSFDQSTLKGLPGKPVKPGDSWPYNVTMNLPQFGSISIKGTYTFKGMSSRGGANCAELEETGELNMNMGGDKSATAPTNPLQQLGMKVDHGNIKGTTWFDPQLGAVREAQFAQNMSIRMNNPADPTKSLELPMDQKISIKLKGIEDAK